MHGPLDYKKEVQRYKSGPSILLGCSSPLEQVLDSPADLGLQLDPELKGLFGIDFWPFFYILFLIKRK